MDYAKKILYLPFKIKEKQYEKMTRVKYIYLLSSKMGFAKPSEIEEILKEAKENGYLKKQNKIIKTTLKYNKKDISTNIDYDREKLLFEIRKFENPSNKMEETVNITLKNTSKNSKKEIIKNINKLKHDKNIDIEEACHKYLKNNDII